MQKPGLSSRRWKADYPSDRQIMLAAVSGNVNGYLIRETHSGRLDTRGARTRSGYIPKSYRDTAISARGINKVIVTDDVRDLPSWKQRRCLIFCTERELWEFSRMQPPRQIRG